MLCKVKISNINFIERSDFSDNKQSLNNAIPQQHPIYIKDIPSDMGIATLATSIFNEINIGNEDGMPENRCLKIVRETRSIAESFEIKKNKTITPLINNSLSLRIIVKNSKN